MKKTFKDTKIDYARLSSREWAIVRPFLEKELFSAIDKEDAKIVRQISTILSTYFWDEVQVDEIILKIRNITSIYSAHLFKDGSVNIIDQNKDLTIYKAASLKYIKEFLQESGSSPLEVASFFSGHGYEESIKAFTIIKEKNLTLS